MKPQKLADNKYKYVKRYYHPKLGKYKRVSVTLDRDTPQARNRAEVILQERIDNALRSVGERNWTFKDVATEYLRTKKNKITSRTYGNYENIITNHLSESDFYHYKVDTISTYDVQKYLDARYNNGELSRGTISLHRFVIASVINFASGFLNVETIFNNKDIELPKSHSKTDASIFSDNDIATIRKAFSRPIYEIYLDLFNFLLYTGMRVGEACVITIDDFQNGKININKTYNREYANEVQPFPKTEKSNRIITTSKDIQEIVERRIHYNRILFGNEAKLIFATKRNSPLVYSTFNHRLGFIDKRFTSHWCRRTHISLLAEKGWTLKQIMNRVGHTDPSVTLKIYTDVTEGLKANEYDELSDLI